MPPPRRCRSGPRVPFPPLLRHCSRYLSQAIRWKSLFLVTFRYRSCCVSVIMRPSGYFISAHLALGAIWVWDLWLHYRSKKTIHTTSSRKLYFPLLQSLTATSSVLTIPVHINVGLPLPPLETFAHASLTYFARGDIDKCASLVWQAGEELASLSCLSEVDRLLICSPFHKQANDSWKSQVFSEEWAVDNIFVW